MLTDDSAWRTRVAALTLEVRLEEQSDDRAKRKRGEGGLHIGVAATRDKDWAA
jgi:hypothetical protein